MHSNSIKRKLGWVELGLYVGGVVLLAIFFYIRADGERQREEGVRTFQAALENKVVPASPSSGDVVLSTVAAPNQEHWADRRVAEYEESLKVEAGPPLAVMTIDKLGIQVPV
jgi:hypothetical protein